MDGSVAEDILFLSLEIAQVVFETDDGKAGNVVVDDATDDDAKIDDVAGNDVDAEKDDVDVAFSDDDVNGESGITVIGEYRESVGCERGVASDIGGMSDGVLGVTSM